MVNTNQMLLKIKDILEQELRVEFGYVPVSIYKYDNPYVNVLDCDIKFSIPIVKEGEDTSNIRYACNINKEMQKRAELLGLPKSPFKESED